MISYINNPETRNIDGSKYRIGIVVAEWHFDVSEKLLKGALETLRRYSVKEDNITVIKVPGSVEIVSTAKWLAQTKKYDAIICLGCVIQGETKHFDYVCDIVTQGLTQLNLTFDIPFIFGILTTYNKQQAIERAGGKFGNKGSECAEAALVMIENKNKIFDQ
ncbi:MAG: 6,7-dimethyl-8-ribityllumazine synthase [Bacteroidales bacterium]|nr:6,7-dimethyl-8-ribityllumazine synthase [Bacteroidales bacterium]